jgi:hypothetical protein
MNWRYTGSTNQKPRSRNGRTNDTGSERKNKNNPKTKKNEPVVAWPRNVPMVAILDNSRSTTRGVVATTDGEDREEDEVCGGVWVGI